MPWISSFSVRRRIALAVLLSSMLAVVAFAMQSRLPAPLEPSALRDRAHAVLAQVDGTVSAPGLREPVEVLRDQWGTPHIYAKNTHDLFFAQGFTVAQDRMWQIEMWRRNGEGRLSEVLGDAYVTRDKFARLLAYRGDWSDEFRKYHPDGELIFTAFANGVNAAIRNAIDRNKIPLEFDLMGFRPEPVWTARTVLTRMPGWTLTRNASSEVRRALDIQALGIAKLEELKPTNPEKSIVVPPGLDLTDIDAAILDIARDANNMRFNLGSSPPPASSPLFDGISPNPWVENADLGSNNWVIGGRKSATGMPILANDPHREVGNPAFRYLVHLNAPGWNAIGATEPGLPGISIGHNDYLAWGFTIVGVDQQDLYVEETDPQNPNHYLADGTWREMAIERTTISVKDRAPVGSELKFTRHGPVLYENAKKHRAVALRWVGAETGGAGYLGSLNLMETKTWDEFNRAMPKAWFIPSFSVVYADVTGNYGYVSVAQTPLRKNWDGLLPVPGKDSQYEWAGYVPYDKLPKALNGADGFYNSSNNNVVPKIVPGYQIPLGYEYTDSSRYDRVHEVLSAARKFSVADMQALQQDTISMPARELVPLLRDINVTDPMVRQAKERLLAWDDTVGPDSSAATIYEYWVLNLGRLAYAPRLPQHAEANVRDFDIRRVIKWMKSPDESYGSDEASRRATRDRILATALEQAVTDVKKRLGESMDKWQWGQIHTADLLHPIASLDIARSLFLIDPVRRGGDGLTVMLTSAPSLTSTKQVSGASIMFVFDVSDWDRSTGLNVPGNSAQPLSPHYKDLAPYWGEGRYFPVAYSRTRVEAVAVNRLILQPDRK